MITITGKKINSSNPLVLNDQQAYQFAFCKFENVVLADVTAPYVEFVGCFFDNVTLKNLEVREVNFLACLGHGGDKNIKIIDSQVLRVQAIYSNIQLLQNGEVKKWQYGDQQFIPLLLASLDAINTNRANNLSQITTKNVSGNMLISAISTMLDVEWDIRAHSLNILNKLGQQGFDIAHRQITDFLISFLGDPNPLVMYQAQDFIRDHRLSEQRVVEVLKNDIDCIFSYEKEKVLWGIKILLNIITMRSLDKKGVIDLAFPLKKFIARVNDSDNELRLKFYELLDKFDDPRFNDIIIHGFQSSSEEIRVESLKLVSLLTTPPDLKAYGFLLKDQNEVVRAEAFYATYTNGDFQETIVQENLKTEKSKLVLEEIQKFQEN